VALPDAQAARMINKIASVVNIEKKRFIANILAAASDEPTHLSKPIIACDFVRARLSIGNSGENWVK
jgi:hypothetical protein